MNKLLIGNNILIILLWIVAGYIYAVFSLKAIDLSLRNIDSNRHLASINKVMIGALIRFSIIGLLLIISMRMNIAYALLLTLTFILSRFLLIRNFSRNASIADKGKGI